MKNIFFLLSLFVRGSENLTLVALCGQFRARDCRNVTTFLCCSSQPSIEACSKFEFGCALIHYRGLEGNLDIFELMVIYNMDTFFLIYQDKLVALDRAYLIISGTWCMTSLQFLQRDQTGN